MPETPSLHLLLDWALRALSLFDTVALLWLGLTILLTAERRTWGVWAAGSGLVVGGLFLAAHTRLHGQLLAVSLDEADLWWRAGWLPFFGAPLLWYVVVGWYTRALQGRRHRLGLAAVVALGLVALALLALGHLPTPVEAPAPADLSMVQLGIALYALFALLCVGLALETLRHPGTAERFMGEQARQRARPWLVAASLALGALSVVVALGAWWLAPRLLLPHDFSAGELWTLALFDLALLGLVALGATLAGRAIVAYEIFTGAALPRGGLLRHWQRSLALAAGYALLVGASLTLPVDPIMQVLLATILMTGLAALGVWRAYAEREQGIARLRPFVAGRGLIEQLLAPDAPAGLLADTAEPFRALCADVLGARLGYLIAQGSLAPLVGAPLAYGAAVDAATPLPELTDTPPEALLCAAVEPAAHGGARWAIPLWGSRGRVGTLLLGDKRDGGIYTREEMELARAAGERLLDLRAGAELARRLVALQRQRLAEGQVLDRRARRLIHDDVLPRLHAALLALVALEAREPEAGEALGLLSESHRALAGLLRELPPAAAPELARLGLAGALRQAVEQELAGAFDGVQWRLDPAAEAEARALPPLAAEVLYAAAREAIRNAARHGRGEDSRRPLHLTVALECRDGLQVRVEDDGVGPVAGEPEAPGGQGLALHGTLLAVLGGGLTLERANGTTRVVIDLGKPGSLGS